MEDPCCFRRSLKEAIRKNETSMERFRALQAELSDCNVHRAELETQLRQSHDVSPKFSVLRR